MAAPMPSGTNQISFWGKLETLAELTEISKEFDFSDIAEISVTKPRKLGKYQLMTAQNPVFIFTLQNGAKA